MRKKSHHLNIYKLDTSLSGSFNHIKPAPSKPEFVLEKERLSGTFQYRLFVQRNATHKPKWYDLLKDLLSDSGPVLTRSCSFVLFVKCTTHHYVLTGGYSASKIKHMIEDDFGLHMALRMIEPRTLSGISQKAIKGPVRQIYRSVVGYRPDLDDENYNRFLKSVEGKPIDSNLGVHINGKNSLSFTTKVDFAGLEELFKKIETIYESQEKISFPKSYEFVKDADRIAALNDLLVKELNDFLAGATDRDRLYLEFKELSLQFQCSHYALEINGTQYPLEYFSLEHVQKILLERSITNVDLDNLSKIKLVGMDESSNVLEKDSILNMLVFETDVESSTYIYLYKKWHKIYDEYKKYIDNQVSSIQLMDEAMPEWDASSLAREEDYNRFVAEKTKWAVLDHDEIQMQGHSKIEVCDLFDAQKSRFIHVKKTWGSKLSYLFAQGYNSADLYHRSEEFRKKMSKKWPHLFDGAKKKSKVVFAIADEKATDPTFPNNLSFFSKLSLVNTASDLRSMDYEVLLTAVSLKTNGISKSRRPLLVEKKKLQKARIG